MRIRALGFAAFWIPAFAGMTGKGREWARLADCALRRRHPHPSLLPSRAYRGMFMGIPHTRCCS